MSAIEEVVNYYENELKEYINIIHDPYTKLLKDERSPYLYYIDPLSDFYFFLNYLLDRKPGIFSNENNRPLSLFYTKIASDVFSIRQCLYMGQILGAVSLERNIFETYVDTKLILEKETERRLSLYLNYEKVMLWLRIKENKKYLEDLEKEGEISIKKFQTEKEYFNTLFTDDDIQKINLDYEQVKDDYHPSRPYHWAWKIFKEECSGRNPSIKSICKYLGIYADYLHVYTTNSIVVHNTPLMRNMLQRGEGITSVPNFNDNIKSVAGLSMSFAIETINMILNYINYPNADEIQTYLECQYKKTFIDDL